MARCTFATSATIPVVILVRSGIEPILGQHVLFVSYVSSAKVPYGYQSPSQFLDGNNKIHRQSPLWLCQFLDGNNKIPMPFSMASSPFGF